MIHTIKRLLPCRRKIIQLYCALLFNANLKGYISGNIYTGQAKQFCVPGLNCYSCPGAVGSCPLGSLQGAFSASHSTLFYVGGILLLQGIVLGRTICGWLCPFGLVQELLYKLPTRKVKKSPLTRRLSWLKYGILAVFIFLIPMLYALGDVPLPAFCKFLCPAGTLEGGVLLLANPANSSYYDLLGPLFTWKFLVMVSILVGCVFLFRLFCRFLCPLGALYGLFNRYALLGVQVEESQCIHCDRCVRHCKLDIRNVGDAECIHCGECASLCPTKAISFKGLPRPVSSKKQNLLCAAIALILAAVLVFSLIHFWQEDTPATPGNQVGDLGYGYALELVDGTGTLDPTKTGAVTVINFWGTWCTPCIRELPYFDQIAQEYQDSVTVVAVHSSLSGETAAGYVEEYFPGSPIRFALDYPLDESGLTSGYYTSLGGRGTYPYTVILDEEGIIRSIIYTSLTYEELKTAVEDVLANKAKGPQSNSAGLSVIPPSGGSSARSSRAGRYILPRIHR